MGISYAAALDAAIASASPTEAADSPHVAALRQLRRLIEASEDWHMRRLERVPMRKADAVLVEWNREAREIVVALASGFTK